MHTVRSFCNSFKTKIKTADGVNEEVGNLAKTNFLIHLYRCCNFKKSHFSFPCIIENNFKINFCYFIKKMILALVKISLKYLVLNKCMVKRLVLVLNFGLIKHE